MKILLMTLTFVFGVLNLAKGQTSTGKPSTPIWTEADREYLLDNLIRSVNEVKTETKNLTKEQWNFKESPDRWSINQIVEHIALWEILLMHEISAALDRAPNPSNTNYSPDSVFVDKYPNGLRSKKQDALNYTMPFSFAIPLGINEGKNNVLWLTTMRDESINYLKNEKRNIRLHYDCFDANVHQIYIILFGHTDRHLYQIKKVKSHPGYPK